MGNMEMVLYRGFRHRTASRTRQREAPSRLTGAAELLLRSVFNCDLRTDVVRLGLWYSGDLLLISNNPKTLNPEQEWMTRTFRRLVATVSKEAAIMRDWAR